MRVEAVAAFVSISSISLGLAGAGVGGMLAGFAIFHHQFQQFWKAQKMDSAVMRFMVEQILAFTVPFFMTVLFTKPLTLLLGKNISIKAVTSYALFNAMLSVYNYNALRGCI